MPKCPLFKVRNIQAFTLVELLVVIVIIGVLGSVITASLGSARKQARDTKRVSDLKNISQALEQYYTDKGVYPVVNNGTQSSDAGMCIEGSTDLQAVLVPGFLANIPQDPTYNASDCITDISPNCHCYIYRTQGASAKTKEYKLFSKAETTSSAAVSEGGTYYFESASPTETAAVMTLSPGSQYGNWYGSSNTAPTFTRASAAYKNDGSSVASGVPRFETIATGLQGVTIEEGTVNYFLTQGFSYNVAERNADFTGFVYVTSTNFLDVTASTPDAPIPSQPTYKFIKNPAAGKIQDCYVQKGSAMPLGSITNGDKFTFSGYYKTSSSAMGPLVFSIQKGDWTGAVASGQITPIADGQWHRAIITIVATMDYATAYHTSVEDTYTATTGEMLMNGWQIEKKGFATSFTNGTRNGESLTAPTSGIISASQGTIEFLINVTSEHTALSNPYEFATSSGTSFLLIQGYGNGNITAQTSNNGWTTYSNVDAGNLSLGLHRIAVVWSSAKLAIFVDGVQKASRTSPYLPVSLGSTMSFGSSSGSVPIDTQISNIIISSVARGDAELQTRGVLTSLSVDSSTTYKLGLNGSLN